MQATGGRYGWFETGLKAANGRIIAKTEALVLIDPGQFEVGVA